MIGPIVSGIGSIVSGFLGKSAADKASAQNMQIAQQNMQMQEDFAKRGIRWKVQDAKAAGIHPVYALGAPTTSFSPVNFSATADNSMAKMASDLGQDIGRAVHSTRTQQERTDAFQEASKVLTLKNASLQNDLLAAQIAKLRSVPNPPMPQVGPVPEAADFEKRPKLLIGGYPLKTDPTTTNAEEIEKRWGDESFASRFAGNIIAARDLWHNVPSWPAMLDWAKQSIINDIRRGAIKPNKFNRSLWIN